MKHWEEEGTRDGDGIIFGENIISIVPKDGGFIIHEECDRYYNKELTKEETLLMLQEAIDWVKCK